MMLKMEKKEKIKERERESNTSEPQRVSLLL
jgi:hypothetical protein